MAEGFKRIDAIMAQTPSKLSVSKGSPTKKPKAPIAFTTTFPSLKFNSSTYYDHHGYFFTFLSKEEREAFVKAGRTSKGEWGLVVQLGKERKEKARR
jgi:hypothetical protein